MRIAVTGAAGYIGGHLVQAFTSAGHEVSAQDVLVAPGVPWVFDLSNAAQRRDWLAASKPDIVVHLAALYGRVWGEKDMQRTVAMNAGLAAQVAKDTAAVGARLMFMSSSEVYGSAANIPGPVMPEGPLEPLNMYGLSKKWGEEACRVYAPDGLMITRLNMPYGPAAIWPKPGTVPHFSGRTGVFGYNAMHTMLWQAYHGMPITVHRGCTRCFTWVGDTCRGLVTIAESGRSSVWNVNRNDDHISTAELARRCVALVPGTGSTVTETDPDSQITLSKALDNTRLWQLGWRPEVDLDTGMKEALDYVSRFGPDGKWQG